MKSHELTTIGSKFNRFTVTSIPFKPSIGDKYHVNCVCDCGVEKTLRTSLLVSGHTKSCGCLKSESSRATGKASITHGKTHGPEWRTYYSMLRRCYNKNSHAYKDYGERGIEVSQSWRESFINFLSDMGEKPAGMSLERNNNELGYSKENCTWESPKKQCNNRRSNRFITAFGETMTITAWSEKTKLSVSCIAHRIRNGLSYEKALSDPSTPRSMRNIKMINIQS